MLGFTCPEQYVWYTIQDAYKETWAEILRCVFDCVANNEPLYFHCSAGADRGGTVACIIEAILGMSQSDIDKDYELTNFHTGVSTDNNARRRNEGEWKGLINQINALADGSTFRDKVLHWVVSMGFTVDEINAFRKAVIDGNPDIINFTSTVPVTWLNGKSCTYAVGSACTVSNNASYIITEEIPVEYGKKYSFEWYCPTTSASFRMIGINDSGVITEVVQFGPTTPEKTHPVTYEPTVATTTKMRIRGYSSAADTFTPITELKVS